MFTVGTVHSKEALRHTVSHCGLQVTNRQEMVIHSLQMELSMIFSNHICHICIFLVIFIFTPFMASAQELNLSGIPDYGDESVEITTAQMDMHAISMNHFRGFQIAGSLLFGLGRCDDKMMCNEDERDWNKYETGYLTAAQIELAYLWGNDVLLGISVNGYYIVPFLGGADVRMKTVFALTPNDGITMSAGVGVGDHGNYDLECRNGVCDVGETKSMAPHFFYIPIEIGYDHVFNNGFLLGFSIEAHMAFNNVTRGDETKVEPALGFAGSGIRLGYAF